MSLVEIFMEKVRASRKYLNSFAFHGVKKIETPTNRIQRIGNKGKISSD
jgi:hypothetical protein